MQEKSDSTIGPMERVAWPKLSSREQAFVIAYIDNAYSLADASVCLKISTSECKEMFALSSVKRAIAEVQSELDDIDFLNEKWVKAQLLKLFPMVMGEEDVPMVDSQGDQIERRKFHPDIAMRIIEYVVPKNKEVEKNDESNVTVVINLPDNGRTIVSDENSE